MGHKLYVKSKCMTCRGKGYKCPYCDNGENWVEASDKSIKRWFDELAEDRKREIIQILSEGNNK